MKTEINRTALKEQLFTYTQDVAQKVIETDFDIFTKIVEVLIESKFNGATIFTAGNGGSSSTAAHMVNDFVKGCRVHNREGFTIQCLADSNALVTCLANDFDYESIFSIQLKTLGKKGDILVVFSGSGNSPNILKAVKLAKEMEIFTIGFSGRDGGQLANLCDLILIAPTDSMEQLEDMHMLYEHAMVCVIRESLKNMFGMETVNFPQHCKYDTALFDFDGAVSLIRKGWKDVMAHYFIEVLSQAPGAESIRELEKLVVGCLNELTDSQTFNQLILLDNEVQKRGGIHVDPRIYKTEYLSRFEEQVKDRKARLSDKTANPEDYLVSGVKELIKTLRDRGVRCCLVSETSEEDAMQEAELLGLAELFDGGIYGLQRNDEPCSKEVVFQRILDSTQCTSGKNVMSFGGGNIEQLVKNIGGYAFGVATDDVERTGINQQKRDKLLAAGADCIIPDFAGYEKIVKFILND